LREKFPLSRPIAQALAWTFASVCLLLAGCSRTGAGERGGGAAAAHDSQPGAEAASPSDSLVIGRLGRQPGLFTKPRAVGFLAGGDMIVIDRSGRIQRLDPQGAHRLDWRLPAFENGTPQGFRSIRATIRSGWPTRIICGYCIIRPTDASLASSDAAVL
jgi:hypothetical protein